MLVILPAELLPISMVANMFATKCGHRTKGVGVLHGENAIEFSLLSCLPILRQSHVKWYTDNQATAKIVEVGSMKLELQTLALKIFKICYKHSIHLDNEWVPRDLQYQSGFY